MCLAFITLTPLERTISRAEIECPGDTIPYSCSVLSNSENIILTWRITLPGQTPIEMTYDNTSSFNTIDYLGINISTTLTVYDRESAAESIITLTVLNSALINGTELKCRSADLDSVTTNIYVNKSGKSYCVISV